MSSPDTFFGDPTRPVGGNVVAHTSTYRIYFKKSGKKRIARMVDSPHHPEQEVIFALGEIGVMDLDSDTKKKPTKTTKASKTEDIPKTETEDIPKTETEDIPKTETEDIPKTETKVESKTEENPENTE
jgi:DNA repair protein RadA